MFIVGPLMWWYGVGWWQRAMIVKERLAATIDYFSIDLLMRSWFAPFRQISAGRVDGPIGVRWRAFVDRLVSRCIGAVVRTILIVIGGMVIVAWAVLGLVSLLLWALVPVLPIIGCVMMIVGWVPSWP